MKSHAVALALVTSLLSGSSAFAQSAATQRSLRNLESTFANVKEDPQLLGDLPTSKQQTAKNLLKDCDYAIGRGDRELGAIAAADRGLPAVAEAQKRLDQIKEYRNKLAAVLDASTKGASELQGKYRAFRDEAKSFERTVNTLSKVGPTTAFEAPTLKALGKDLDGLAAVCTKHMPMAHDDNLAFQLAVDPPAWCALPPKRAELFLTLANNAVKRDVGTWTKLLQEMRTGLSKGQGFVSFPGNFLEELVMNRDATREKTLTQYKAIYAAAQAAPPSDMFAPIDTEVDAFLAEVDRLAPTWTWPTGLTQDAALEKTGKAAIEKAIPGAKVSKIAMLKPEWTISKNELGIILDRYRTGVVLYKSPKDKKWCHFREWTLKETYAGAGKYEKSSTPTLSGIRYQKCL